MAFMNQETVNKKELLGKFDQKKHTDFSKISSRHTDKKDIYLRKETYTAFQELYYDAKANGFDIKIVSATRNFNYQKGIWERKFSKEKYAGWPDEKIVKDILKYSSMPGTSRHHWGTDIDINSFENTYFENGKGKELYNWMQSCGQDYGFHQVYTSKSDERKGYEEEKWHWTFLPLSKTYLKEYNRVVNYSDIIGFKGANKAESVHAIEYYVNGINPIILID